MYTLFRNHTAIKQDKTRRSPFKTNTFTRTGTSNEDELHRTRVEKPAFNNDKNANLYKDAPCKPRDRRCSYSTLSTRDEIETNDSLAISCSTNDDEGCSIPDVIWFYRKIERRAQPSIPPMQKAKSVQGPMTAGDYSRGDTTGIDHVPLAWPKPQDRASSLPVRKSPRQLLDEMDSSVSQRKQQQQQQRQHQHQHQQRNGRPVLRRELSRGLHSLVPPIRPTSDHSSQFDGGSRLEI